MKTEVLSRFDNPLLMVIAMAIFIGLFGFVFFRTISKNRNKEYEEASKLPFKEAGE